MTAQTLFAPRHGQVQPLAWQRDPGSCAHHRSWTLERPRPPVVSPAQQRTMLGAPWLADLSIAAREALMAALSVIQVRAGDRVLHQGELATSWCGVASGAVRLSSLSASGRQLTLAMVAPGEWFGESSAFGGMAEPSSADAQADSVLVSLRLDDLRRLTHSHDDLRHALLCWSSAKQRAWMAAAMEATAAPLSQRLALRLLDLGRRFGRPQGAGFQLALHLTQTDLAQFVAASRQRLNQGMQDLRHAGVLDTQDGQITVLSTEALQQRAGTGRD